MLDQKAIQQIEFLEKLKKKKKKKKKKDNNGNATDAGADQSMFVLTI